MIHRPPAFDAHHIVHQLKHYLPAQAPLKDFVHHNTLHSFQHLPFEEALRTASAIFGYKLTLSLQEYRQLYQQGRIRKDVLQQVIAEQKGKAAVANYNKKLLEGSFQMPGLPRIGALRSGWKKHYQVDLDSLVQPTLFRILCSYLDQGISIWSFPVTDRSFLDALREMERNSLTSFFRKKRSRRILLETECRIEDLLHLLVGREDYYEHYLYDQQFAHPGWSGMVSAIEDQPQTLLDRRNISLHDLIVFELLLELDALDYHNGDKWEPLAFVVEEKPEDLFAPVPPTELDEALAIWQQAFERSYYDQVLAGIQQEQKTPRRIAHHSFQGLFCIDDRECSFRRYLENEDPACATFGTPGFFGVEFFYQPEGGKFYTKLCPAPVTPKYLVKEVGSKQQRHKDPHFTKHSHPFHSGWLISQTLGFWSAVKLAVNIFRPSTSPAATSSFKHMDHAATLTIENKNLNDTENGLQIGFTVAEMATRVEGVLRSIGLVHNFALLVYVVGHGASSVNNPHFAAYDCGACSGRAGSVNARVLSFMANHPEVRAILRGKGIDIPESTRFVGALHDTTVDDIQFYDVPALSKSLQKLHWQNVVTFLNALDCNAKERSRRLELVDSTADVKAIHEKVRRRAVSLFEPRPELNHATNALCIVGRRELSKGLFLDRRSFLNSYNYAIDPDGTYLFNILKAAAPVCGGINLEYYFSRVDNQKLGAGTKLPHNVMGLFGVANGIDGDLRPGLPSQMIEVHDPVRILFIVEHYPEVVLQVINRAPETYEWFGNEWVHLAVVHPETGAISLFRKGSFEPYKPLLQELPAVADLTPLLETATENFPVYLLKTKSA